MGEKTTSSNKLERIPSAQVEGRPRLMSHWLRPASPELGSGQSGLFELFARGSATGTSTVLLFGAGASIPAAKYAGEAATAAISLEERNGELRFEVADDGAGFDPASANGSAGMQNMADRIGALGGELRVKSAAGEGTLVEGRIAVA